MRKISLLKVVNLMNIQFLDWYFPEMEKGPIDLWVLTTFKKYVKLPIEYFNKVITPYVWMPLASGLKFDLQRFDTLEI